MRVLIKNGRVYDGSGRLPENKDILIRGDKIVRVGIIQGGAADFVIDAEGTIVAPGFIDVNTDSDHYLSIFYEPYQEDFLRQGITTIIGGNCGSSLAPLLTGSLDSIRKWGNPSRANINWRTVDEFLKILESKGVGVNFGTLVGLSTVRRGITRDESRDLTDAELASLLEILEQSFDEGAFGLSTGLSYVHSRKIPYYEIKNLVEMAAKRERIYATHLRNYEKGVLASVKETLELGKEVNANIEISHFEPIKGFTDLYKEAADLIAEAASSSHTHFDIYPFDSVALTIYTFLPQWMQEGGLETMFGHISSFANERKLLEHFLYFMNSEITIGHVSDPSLKFLEGKTLKEYAVNQGLEMNEALLQIMRITRLRAILLYKNIDFTTLQLFLSHPMSIISSNGTSLGPQEFKYERNYSTFTKFLKMVVEKNLMPFEKAIEKITALPAGKYKIRERGIIKEGYAADIVILRNYEPTEVIVNGKLAVAKGSLQKVLAGRILRR